MKFLFKLSSLLASQTALFVALAAALAFAQPEAFKWVKGDTQAAILGLIMLTMGMTLSASDFKILLEKPLYILIGALAQYTLMPLGALAIVHALGLPQGIAAGLMLVGCCPGGVSSNIMSFLAKGDLAYSVGMTSVSTLLSPIVTPALMLFLSGHFVEIDALSMFKSILIVTLIPVCLGMFLNFLLSKFEFYKSLVRLMPALSVISLALIVGGVTAHQGSYFFTSGLTIFCAIALHNALGYAGGYAVAKLFKMRKDKCRTLSIEVGCQNAGLATNLASAHFQALPESAVASAVACVYHSLSGTVLANAFAFSDRLKSKRAKKRAKIPGASGRLEPVSLEPKRENPPQ